MSRAASSSPLQPSADELERSQANEAAAQAEREAQIENEMALERLIQEVPHDSSALWRAPPHFRKTKGIVLQCVQYNGHCLVFASPALQGDRDVVRAAVMQDGGALRYASDDLRADAEIVRLAVRADGSALYYADDSLQADREIALAAVGQDALAVPFVESRLRSSPEVQRQASMSLERTRSNYLTREQTDAIGVTSHVSPGGRMSQREGSRGFDPSVVFRAGLEDAEEADGLHEAQRHIARAPVTRQGTRRMSHDARKR